MHRAALRITGGGDRKRSKPALDDMTDDDFYRLKEDGHSVEAIAEILRGQGWIDHAIGEAFDRVADRFAREAAEVAAEYAQLEDWGRRKFGLNIVRFPGSDSKE